MDNTITTPRQKAYYFTEIVQCEMCGDSTSGHIVMGQRLNQSQGFSPRKKTGISVSVKKCRNCGLIYSYPQPVPFDIQDHYGTPPEEYWKPGYFEWKPGYFAGQIEAAKRLLDFKDQMKALDIGAGLGKAMISLNKAGFDAYGFEPSIPFYERAISKMGINPDRLKLGMVEEMEYPDDFFDFITFGAVFEHLYHPATILEKAFTWLKPGGIIHIEVPSSRHLISRLMNIFFTLRGTNYVTNLSPMHTPFHLYEFSLKSFGELGKKLNFSIVEHRYDVCEVFMFPRVFHPFLKTWMKWTKTGMQLTIYLRK